MSKEQPDHHDAELVLKLYDLRRENVMRASRDALNSKFFPQSYEDIKAIAKPDHPLNAAFRQVTSYWEMVFGMAKNSIVNTEYLMESSAEGLLTYAKIVPYLEQFRKDFFPTAFQNAEWIVAHSDRAKYLLKSFENRLKDMAAAAKGN
ncbi:MAG TPA: hypothetical protein VFC63_25495 [Blastocatellia bacterium]|nr:hypothetical protein [Blastocatellia bacterium]